jgi:hypothetical protein
LLGIRDIFENSARNNERSPKKPEMYMQIELGLSQVSQRNRLSLFYAAPEVMVNNCAGPRAELVHVGKGRWGL